MQKSKYKILFPLLIFICCSGATQSQTAVSDSAAKNSNWAFELDAETFFYDAEYATPLAQGYTITGFRLSPAISFGSTARPLPCGQNPATDSTGKALQLRVGFNAVVFAGLDSMYLLRPTVSIIYSPARWLTLIGGTINDEHHLPQPLYDQANDLLFPQEDGLQILTHTKHWKSDTWLDWHHYLVPWTADQERFTVGTHHTFNLLQYSKFRIQSSLLSMAEHRGGEVKTIDTNTVTTFNHNIAIDFAYLMNNSTLSIRMPLYFYHLEDSELDNGGIAFHPTLAYRLRFRNMELCLDGGYWYGDHFFAPNGAPQFWSANNYTALHIAPSNNLASVSDTRQLITFSAALQHSFRNLDLTLSACFYHDTDLRKTDLTVAFAMNYNIFKSDSN